MRKYILKYFTETLLYLQQLIYEIEEEKLRYMEEEMKELQNMHQQIFQIYNKYRNVKDKK